MEFQPKCYITPMQGPISQYLFMFSRIYCSLKYIKMLVMYGIFKTKKTQTKTQQQQETGWIKKFF